MLQRSLRIQEEHGLLSLLARRGWRIFRRLAECHLFSRLQAGQLWRRAWANG